MSLQDDIKTVYNALKGSDHPYWPEPEKGSAEYVAFTAFHRICDQMPTGNMPGCWPGPGSFLYEPPTDDSECEPPECDGDCSNCNSLINFNTQAANVCFEKRLHILKLKGEN